MSKLMIEIRVRAFFIADSGATAVPGASTLAEVSGDGGLLPPFDLAEPVAELREAVRGLMMRPMTDKEASAYLRKEDAEGGLMVELDNDR